MMKKGTHGANNEEQKIGNRSSCNMKNSFLIEGGNRIYFVKSSPPGRKHVTKLPSNIMENIHSAMKNQQ